jgi:hypothetical protein
MTDEKQDITKQKLPLWVWIPIILIFMAFSPLIFRIFFIIGKEMFALLHL